MDRNRKRLSVLFCFAAVTMLLFSGCTGRVLRREQLEAMWIERMLQGRSEDAYFPVYVDKPADLYPNPTVVLPTAGDPRTWGVEKGIRIRDPRGSYLWHFFGTRLSEGGGWELRGGRLKAVALPDGSLLDLFILQMIRWHPAMIPLWGTYYGKSDVSFKVFLLKRHQTSGKAAILHTWEIPPDQVKWYTLPGPANVMDALSPTASLAYDPTQKRATVTITGITQDITEHLTINREIR